jgi:hypothetical protein
MFMKEGYMYTIVVHPLGALSVTCAEVDEGDVAEEIYHIPF